jgi:hypothetical protein
VIETPGQSDADRGFEMALRSVSPASPRGAVSDAAYEAGRRDGAAQHRGVLWIHRLATAAAIVMAAVLGARALLSEQSSRQLSRDDTVEQPRQEQDLLAERASEPSPFSYVALRSAVMREGEVDWSHFPAASAGGTAGAREDVRSIGDALREQRGM